MDISYSLLGSDHLNLLKDLENNKNHFTSIHFDMTDNYFCETLGLSILTLEQLASTTAFKIDVHLLVERAGYVLRRIENLRINSVTFHLETFSHQKFNGLNNNKFSKGIGLLPTTKMENLKNYLDTADSVLLLCITPSLFPDQKFIHPVDRVNEFRNFYPDYKGEVIVDGGLDVKYFPELEKLQVNKLVLGQKFFE
jgi:ribulose-phosphate 3-epimerase|tara:strand:+ start:5213 stop:5800 length:588 start_codon:yes stop_codon:yes gene_type:complete